MIRALRTTGIPFDFYTDVQTVLASLPREVLVLDLDSLADRHLGGLASDLATISSPCRVIFASNGDLDVARLGGWMSRGLLTNLVAVDRGADELRVTLQKILRNDLFGIEKYFGWGIQLKRFKLTQSKAREQILDQVELMASYAGTHQRLRTMFRTVAEECITNAFYNAPVDETGASRYRHLPRGEAVSLQSNEEIVVTVASDGRRLAISTLDPFGSLSEELLLQKLSTSLLRPMRSPSFQSGGAGLGISFLFDSSTQLIINLEPHRRTEFICIIRSDGSFRDFRWHRKSINVFMQRRG